MTALPMTSRAVNLCAEPSPGDSVLIRGNRYVVLERLPSLPGRPPAARVTPDLPCCFCDDPLLYNDPRGRDGKPSLEPGRPGDARWWCLVAVGFTTHGTWPAWSKTRWSGRGLPAARRNTAADPATRTGYDAMGPETWPARETSDRPSHT